MSVVDFKIAKNNKKFPSENFENLVTLFKDSARIVNFNLYFLWPYAVFLWLFTDGVFIPNKPQGLSALVTKSTLIHTVFGFTFLQLVYSIFAAFIVVGFKRPSFSSLQKYIYDSRHKLLIFAAVVFSYYIVFSLSVFLIVPIFILPIFFFFIEPICLFENKGFKYSFSRSMQLVNGAKISLLLVNFAYIIGAFIVIFICAQLPIYLISLIVGQGGLLGMILRLLEGLVISYFIMIFVTFKTVLYLKRVKKVS